MEMQMKWQQKKANSDFTADGSMKLDAVSRQAEEIRQAQADGSAKLAAQIRTKLANGKKLTAEEMEYLQKNDPQMYQKVKSIEAEQKNYENELKRCKTKEEVQRVRMNHTAASLSTVNSIKNNPAIPEEKKLELIWREHMKNMALEETTREFVESGQYAKLPTEAEKAEAFSRVLEEAFSLPVRLWDERRTTIDAHNILASAGKRAKARKKTVDAVAAALILEGYLTFRRGAAGPA